MNKGRTTRFLFLLIMSMMILSCARKETLEPNFTPSVSSRSNQNIPDAVKSGGNGGLYYMRGKYFLDDLIIDKEIKGPIIVDEIANTIVNLIVFAARGIEISPDPIEIDASEVDVETLRLATINAIEIRLLDEETLRANLKFIKKIEISLLGYSPDGNLIEEKIISYNRKNIEDERRSRKCKWKCLSVRAKPLNLINFIQNGKIIIKPSLSLGKVPGEVFFLGGHISFVLGLDIPI